MTDAPTPSGRRGARAAVAGVVDAGAIFAAGVARALIGAAACTGVSRSDTNATATSAAATSDGDDREAPARRAPVQPAAHRREPGPVADRHLDPAVGGRREQQRHRDLRGRDDASPAT